MADLRPGRRHRAIPIADASLLGAALRRTAVIRVTLLGAAVLLAGLTVWRGAAQHVRTVSFLPEGSTTIVVLDQSRSVYIAAYKRIAAALTQVVQGDPSIGLIAFSDTAYELLPPGSHGADLKAMLRYYRPRGGGANVDPATLFPASPWDNVFSGGTKISAGLELARQVIARDNVKHATIFLVSDLETAGEDLPALGQVLVKLTHDPRVTIRIAPLFPILEDRAFFGRFLPQSAFVKPSQVATRGPAEPRRKLLAQIPWPFMVAGGLLLLLLAANELLCSRVELPRPLQVAP